MLQQIKPGEPPYAQVNLEKKKKRQYDLGIVQSQSTNATLPASGSQWVNDGIQDIPPQSINGPTSSTSVSAGDSWV